MRRLLCGFVVLLMAARVFAANTETRLVLSATAARQGDVVWAGIELKMPAGWHSYWRNGGDAGLPTKIQWVLPDGITAGELQWPVPERLTTPAGSLSLISYVYEGDAALCVPLQIQSNAPFGLFPIEARVAWQECGNEGVCVLGKSVVRANLAIGQALAPSADAPLIAQWREKVPRIESHPKARARWMAPAGTNDSREVAIEWETAAAQADFYPYASADFEVSGAAAASSAAPGRIELRMTVSKSGATWPEALQGLLVSKGGEAIEVTLPISEPDLEPVAGNGGNPAKLASLPAMLLFAFLGGLMLNLMPCVLPVISLKVLAFINQSGQSSERLRRMGLSYALGILVSFAVLAVFSILAQRAGGVAGWGAAFRNPQFRMGLTVVVTLVALNLFGVFEVTLSGRAMDAAGRQASREGYSGAFLNGVLAAVLGTPCMAPFLGGALAFAFTQPPVVIAAAFLTAGAGLALPFVLICLRPSLLKCLPRSGAWMEQFKGGVGFAVLATAMWLFWLTGTRLGKDGVLWLGLFLVSMSFAAWLWGQFVQRPGKGASIGAVCAIAILLAGYFGFLETKLHWRQSAPTSAAERIDWRPWSPQAVVKAQAEGHPVLVDFTADSCLNCQVNKLTSLEISSVRAKLKAIGAVALIADYTDENAAIAKELERFQRPGVPLVLVYPGKPQAAPIVLPTLLTPSIVEEALARAAR